MASDVWWRPLFLVASVNLVAASLSSQYSFQWGPLYPGLISSSSHGVFSGLDLQGRFSLSPLPAGPPVSGPAE